MDWKRIFLRAAGFGAGFAIMLALVAGILLWYRSRPRPPRPWDTRTIQAKFDGAAPETTNGKIGLRYVPTNNGEDDFRISDGGSVQVAIRLGDDNELLPFNRVVSIDTPIFVPAGHKAMVFLDLKTGETTSSFNRQWPPHATDAEEKEYQKAVIDYLSGTRISGFSAFDEARRLEIDFPAGWKTPAKK